MLTECIIRILSDMNIQVLNMHEQSYEIASDMKEKHSGVQHRNRDMNLRFFFIKYVVFRTPFTYLSVMLEYHVGKKWYL